MNLIKLSGYKLKKGGICIFTESFLTRHKNYIDTLLAYPVQKGSTLLIGSSFFTHWGYDRVKSNFPRGSGKRGIINHGFGGSTIDEILYYYDKILRPYEPSAVMLRTGANDLGNDLSPEQTIFLFDRLVTWIRTDFPDAEIISLPIFDLPSFNANQPHLLQPSREYNRLMKEYAEAAPHLKIWDINKFFYKNPDDAGTLRGFKDFFLEDNLHLTQEGYDEFETYFRSDMTRLL